MQWPVAFMTLHSQKCSLTDGIVRGHSPAIPRKHRKNTINRYILDAAKGSDDSDSAEQRSEEIGSEDSMKDFLDDNSE
jgi:hypothetical protein